MPYYHAAYPLPQTLRSVLFLAFVFCWGSVLTAQPYSLAAVRARTTLGSGTTATSWQNVTDNGGAFEATVTLTGTVDVLVMASFSARPLVSTSDTGRFRLTNGTDSSTPIYRTLTANTNDYGIATVTWLFTGLSGSQTFHLQQETVLGNGIQTSNATIVALPLNVSDGITDFDLDSGTDNMGAYEFTSSSATGETVEKAAGTDLAASVTLGFPGSMFVAASFNAKPGAGASLHVGEWQLQVDGTTVSTTQRTMQSAGGNDRGAITLYGLAEGLSDTAHSVTILTKSVSGDPIITYSAVVVGVGLSFDDAGGTALQLLPSWTVTGSSSTVAPGTANAATKSGVVYADTTATFLAASYNNRTEVRNTAQVGYFQLNASGGPTSYVGETERRALSGITDIGSGGNVGLATALAAGTYSFNLQAANVQGGGGQAPTMTTNAVLVGFGLTSEAAGTGTIEGRVFLDDSRDGTYDAGEELVGIGVTITASDATVYNLVTDSTGFFQQTGVATGNATVDVTDGDLPASLSQTVGTDPTVVSVTSGGTATDLNGYVLTGNLKVAKIATNGTTFTIGDTIDYHIDISVPAGSSFTNVVVTDTLPVDIDAVTAVGEALTITTSSVNVTHSAEIYNHTLGSDVTAQILSISLGTVANASATVDGGIHISYTATVQNSAQNSAGQTKTNNVALAADGPINETTSASIDLVEPQLGITKTVRNATTCTPSRSREGKLDYHAPEPDDILEYTVTITNTGTAAAYNLTIEDTLDAGLEYITATGDIDYRIPEGDITTNPDVAGSVLTWGHAQSTPLDLDLAPGGTLTFHYRVRVLGTVNPGDSLNNSATVTWYSLDGGSGRDGTGGVNDYTSTATTTVSAWSDPSASTFTATGGAATVADDGTTAGNITAGTFDGLSLLFLQDTASVTITGDGIPNQADGTPDPFGLPSATVEAAASAVIISDGTASVRIDDLVLNNGSTLELQGDTSYRIGALSMGTGAKLIVPDGAEVRIRGLASLQGLADEANHALIESAVVGGDYTIYFDCSVDADFVHFSEMGSGHVEFAGPTALNHVVFTDGSGTDPYVQYFYSGSPTWTYLAFDKSAGKTTTIENLNTGTVTVDTYMGPTIENWLGGDASESQNPGTVTWLNATPARDLRGEVTAPASGGIILAWQTSLEDGVCLYRVMRADGRRWVEAGTVWAKAEPFRGASYEFLDRTAPVGKTSNYRLDVVDNDGTCRNWPLGSATALALAPTAPTRAFQAPFVAPQRSQATLTELAGQVASYATDTPTQTGTARRATITATGLYEAPDGGNLYNVGQPLPRLPGNGVFVRALSDYYTDANVLWAGDLTIEGTPGVVPEPPVTAVLTSQGLEGVYHVEEDSSFTINDYLPPGPNWYFSRSFELKGGSTCTVSVDIASPRSGTAHIAVNVRATSTTAHDLGIVINGTSIAQATWDKPGHFRIEADFPANLLRTGENLVQLQTDTVGSTKRLDYVEIQTPVEPALRAGDLLVRVAEGAASALRVPGAAYAVDATTFGAEEAMPIADGTVSSLSAGQLVFLTDAIRPLDWSEERNLSLDGSRGANYVAIAPADLLPELAPLLALRRNEGRQTASFTLEDAQDIFGGGLFGPAAVVRLARDLSPTYLLLGAGTTYDYKRIEGRSTPLGIPCGFVHVYEGMAASDDLYTADFTVAVGRLPARTSTELANTVAKIVAFQPGRRVAMLADADDTGSSLDRFAALQRDLADIMPGDLIQSSGRTGSAIRTDLINAIRGGDKLVAYQGHGGNEYLGYGGNRIFGVEHCNQVPPSAWLLSTCLTGSYIVNDTSIPILSHRLLTTPVNGAVSVLCSTRYGDANIEHEIVRLALTRMAQGGATWGDILLLLKREIGETETGQVYTLLGDPAMRAVDLASTRELAVLAPNAGDLTGAGGKVPVRFRLLGEGWTGQTVDVCYRRGYANWTPIATVQTVEGTVDYEVEWTPPADGADYQIMVREVQP